MISGPVVDTSCPGKKHETKQKILKEFFYRNPTPACVEVEDKDDNDAPEILVQSSTSPAGIPVQPLTSTAGASVQPANQHAPIADNPPSANFYSQLLKTLKTINQTAPQQQKIVVESREYEESVDLAKLQTSMLKLFYVNGKNNWDEGTIKNATLATFAKGFKDLLGCTATVQEAQFANLLNTISSHYPTTTRMNSQTPSSG